MPKEIKMQNNVKREVKVSKSEMNERIKQVTMEAEFRFRCLELASPLAKTKEELLSGATELYNYAFHISPTISSKDLVDAKN
tara:strand:- start:1083 stop:1328 length:246 start_codon:yes stop_codon:yes gene_type:complete